MSQINIKYLDDSIERIQKITIGDWIDLRCYDAQIININNAVKDIDGKIILKRETKKIKVNWENGIFEDKPVKFFRYKAGDFILINLGVAMELPEGYEANIVPRSSTFKTYTTLQTNSFGVIDESYKGDNDIWFMPVLAVKDGFIIKNERVCQFRINKKMPDVTFNEVEFLNNNNRGGFGSTKTL